MFGFPDISYTFPAGIATDTTFSVAGKTFNEYRALESSLNLKLKETFYSNVCVCSKLLIGQIVL